jgi:hypothetical protein
LTPKYLTAVALTVLAAAGLAGCGDSPESEARGESAVGLCRGHGGAIALEDDIVICRDQTYYNTE